MWPAPLNAGVTGPSERAHQRGFRTVAMAPAGKLPYARETKADLFYYLANSSG
jgi:hypothetical protein